MARTLRSIPAWIKNTPGNDAWTNSKYFQRAARGQDGAIRSEIAQSAKAGKRDDWSTAPKGRANKRIATKQIRRFNKAEAARHMAMEEADATREAAEARVKVEAIAELQNWLAMEESELGYLRAMVRYTEERIASLKAQIDEL